MNNWEKTNTTFFIEVEFDELFPRTSAILLDAVNGNGQLLPGLRVNKIMNTLNETDNSSNKEMMDDLNYIKRLIAKFIEKYDENPAIESKSSTVIAEEFKPTKPTIKPTPKIPKDNKTEFQSEWIENNGKNQIIPDMIF